jgi:hypothetical protein
VRWFVAKQGEAAPMKTTRRLLKYVGIVMIPIIAIIAAAAIYMWSGYRYGPSGQMPTLRANL